MYIAYHTPSATLTNDDLELLYDDPKWTSRKILRKTGIENRPVAQGELVSDMALKACESLFDEYKIERDCIDALILCTQSPDYLLPTTACLLQYRLGLRNSILAFDYNLGCSGFVYGLGISKGLIDAGLAGRVMLVTAESYTKHIHPFDRSTRTIFGDAASATLLTKEETDSFGNFVFGTDGSGGPNLMIPAGGMALPRTLATSDLETDRSGNQRSKDNLYMNGPEIFSFTLRIVPEMVDRVLEINKTNYNEIDLVVFHQANEFILKTLRDKIGIPPQQFLIDVKDTGNTVSCSIPIALRRAVDSGRIRKGAKVLVAGFGVGYSWGSTIITI